MEVRRIWSEYMTRYPLYNPAPSVVSSAVGHLFRLWAFEAKQYSQNEEDGILYYILQQVNQILPVSQGRPCVVELGSGDGYQNNSSNLIQHHGYCGVLVDGNRDFVTRAQTFFQGKSDVVRIIHRWITRDNIVPLLLKEIESTWCMDVLILDIDGNDFWVLQSVIESGHWKPRVILVEYQDILGPVVSKTIPYDENYYTWVNPWNSRGCKDGPNFSGASLMAFVRLLRPYNYLFVGCEPNGFNGFFVHKDCIPPDLHVFQDDEIPIMFDIIPKVRDGIRNRFPFVKDAPWVDPFV